MQFLGLSLHSPSLLHSLPGKFCNRSQDSHHSTAMMLTPACAGNRMSCNILTPHRHTCLSSSPACPQVLHQFIHAFRHVFTHLHSPHSHIPAKGSPLPRLVQLQTIICRLACSEHVCTSSADCHSQSKVEQHLDSSS